MKSKFSLGKAPRLEVDRLTKYYQDKAALKDVSLVAEPGSFIVLLGPSGSGKSTMVRTIAGIERVSSGEIRFDQSVVASCKYHLAPEYRELAMVFQDYALWPHMTAVENVAFALRRRGLTREMVKSKSLEMLDRMGMDSLAKRYPGDLSGGEQQRVALARALVADPGLLLFDEPLSNLDADLRERLRVEIATLTRETGATAVYITHDQSEAFALADKIGVLETGKLVQFATPEDIYRQPATAFVARFTGLAGELPCVIHNRSSDNQVGIRVDEHLLTGQITTTATIPANSLARLLVRSTAVTLVGEASADTSIPAVVRDVAFRGRGYDHVVEIAGKQRLEGIFDSNRHECGRNVRLQFDMQGCLVFPEDSPSPSPLSSPPASLSPVTSSTTTVPGLDRQAKVSSNTDPLDNKVSLVGSSDLQDDPTKGSVRNLPLSSTLNKVAS